jgi:hypothetical protein
MNSILPHAQAILYTLIGLMPSSDRRLSLQASLAMFFEPSTGAKLPEHSVIRSGIPSVAGKRHNDTSTIGIEIAPHLAERIEATFSSSSVG